MELKSFTSFGPTIELPLAIKFNNNDTPINIHSCYL